MPTIDAIETRLYNVPLAEVLVDAKHGAHTYFELICATVHLSDGSTGTGYSYTGGRGGQSVAAMIRHDLTPFLLGRDGADVEALNEAMGWHMHYVARGGIAAFAQSAVDIALWDIRGKATGQPLHRLTAALGITKEALIFSGRPAVEPIVMGQNGISGPQSLDK